MKRLSNWVAWGAAAIVAALAVPNWSVLMAPAPLDLVVARIQPPLGVVMLGLAAVLAALFSRIDELLELITTGSRLLNERLPQAGAQTAPTHGDQEFKPYSLTEILTGHARAWP